MLGRREGGGGGGGGGGLVTPPTDPAIILVDLIVYSTGAYRQDFSKGGSVCRNFSNYTH